MRGAWTLALLFVWLSLAPSALAQGPMANPDFPAPLTPEPPGQIPPDLPLGARPLAGLVVTGEFLYVWPNRDNLVTAMVTSSSDGITNGTLASLTWDGTPAMRVGARYRPPESLMDFGATFTYFHSKAQLTVSAPEGGSLTGVLATDRKAQDATDADGDSGLSYAILDLDVGQRVRLGDTLGVRFFGGVRLASISQSLKCIYTGGALGDTPDFVNSPVRFQGAGLTAGAEATWNLYRGWGFYGRGRFGLVSGLFNSSRTETLGPALIGDASESYFTVVPVAELGVGLTYQGEFFFVKAGYEVTDWLNMVSGINTGPNALTTHKRDDLTLQALTLRFGFAF